MMIIFLRLSPRNKRNQLANRFYQSSRSFGSFFVSLLFVLFTLITMEEAPMTYPHSITLTITESENCTVHLPLLAPPRPSTKAIDDEDDDEQQEDEEQLQKQDPIETRKRENDWAVWYRVTSYILSLVCTAFLVFVIGFLAAYGIIFINGLITGVIPWPEYYRLHSSSNNNTIATLSNNNNNHVSDLLVAGSLSSSSGAASSPTSQQSSSVDDYTLDQPPKSVKTKSSNEYEHWYDERVYDTTLLCDNDNGCRKPA